MGMNYYARLIPSKEKKAELKATIEADDFDKLVKEVEKTYGRFTAEFGEPQGGKVHLGKSSRGWKFLWNPNVYVIRNGHLEGEERRYVQDPNTAYYLYPLTKQGIRDFVMRKDVAIYNEENEQEDKEEFLKYAFSKSEGLDAKSYEEEDPNVKRWECRSELIDLLEQEGFKFTSWTKSDFYSDGLRFASYTEFS